MVSISFPADSSNRSLNVRIVNKGEKYGLNRSLAHDQDEPLVEFYEAPCDQDHSQPYRALGQFVSRYNAKTILDCAAGNRGINLDGCEPSWQIDAEAIVAIGQWIEEMSKMASFIQQWIFQQRRETPLV